MHGKAGSFLPALPCIKAGCIVIDLLAFKQKKLYGQRGMHEGNFMSTVQFETKKFESLSPYLARFGNFFYGFELLGNFEFCAKQAALKPLFGKKYSSCAFVLTLKTGNTEFKIAFEKDDFLLLHPAVKNEDGTVEDLSALYSGLFPEALKQALLESLLLPYMQKFCGAMGEQAQIADISYEEVFCEDKPYLAFVWEIAEPDKDGPWSSLCFVSIPEDMQALSLLDKMAGILPLPSAQALNVPDVPVQIHFSLAETVLPVSDFAALEHGDIILFDEYYGQNSLLRVYPHVQKAEKGTAGYDEYAYFSAEFREYSVNVLGWVQAALDLQGAGTQHIDNGENTMTQNTDENTVQAAEAENREEGLENAPQGMAVSDICVNVHFSLDERVISLQELQNIKAGYVFALDKDFFAPVTLMVQGKAAGKGKIVDINGTVGVQITELFH